MSQNLAQKRAAHALGKIQGLLQNDEKYGNYLAYVKALPATIITSGLGQALAMEKAGASKSGNVADGHRNLYLHMNDWLCKAWETSPYKGAGDSVQAITTHSEDDYIRAQAEVMAYLEWLKKFAVAYLKDDEEQKDDDKGGD